MPSCRLCISPPCRTAASVKGIHEEETSVGNDGDVSHNESVPNAFYLGHAPPGENKAKLRASEISWLADTADPQMRARIFDERDSESVDKMYKLASEFSTQCDEEKSFCTIFFVRSRLKPDDKKGRLERTASFIRWVSEISKGRENASSAVAACPENILFSFVRFMNVPPGAPVGKLVHPTFGLGLKDVNTNEGEKLNRLVNESICNSGGASSAQSFFCMSKTHRICIALGRRPKQTSIDSIMGMLDTLLPKGMIVVLALAEGGKQGTSTIFTMSAGGDAHCALHGQKASVNIGTPHVVDRHPGSLPTSIERCHSRPIGPGSSIVWKKRQQLEASLLKPHSPISRIHAPAAEPVESSLGRVHDDVDSQIISRLNDVARMRRTERRRGAGTVVDNDTWPRKTLHNSLAADSTCPSSMKKGKGEAHVNGSADDPGDQPETENSKQAKNKIKKTQQERNRQKKDHLMTEKNSHAKLAEMTAVHPEIIHCDNKEQSIKKKKTRNRKQNVEPSSDSTAIALQIGLWEAKLRSCTREPRGW